MTDWTQLDTQWTKGLLSDPSVILISSLKSDKGPDESTDVNLT